MQYNLPATVVDLAEVRSDLMSPHDRDISRYPAFTSLRRVGAADHYQFNFASTFANGRGEYCAVSTGMYVQCFDADLADPYRLLVLGPDTLRIRVASAGSCRYWGEFGTESVVSGPMLTLIAEPPGMQPAHFVAEDRQRVAHVYLHRSELASLYSGAEEDLPAPIRAFLRGELCATYLHATTPSAELLDCVSALMNCSLDGRGRWLFFRSKALEIICRVFDSISAADSEAAYGLSISAQRAIAKARRILEQEFTNPPPLDALARAVGLSRTVMCSGFRLLTGKSVYEHVTEIRMQQALILLGKPGVRVADVAHALGYQHASSFTAAVRKFFGTHPRALRRHPPGV
jgi:AraC family transcriptional activator of pyochelin receptor